MIFIKETKISNYFTYGDALWLPQWNRMADGADGLDPIIFKNLSNFFLKMDIVREWFDRPIIIHCSFRPAAYNALPTIKGAPGSMHVKGRAADFHIQGFNCDFARGKIMDSGMLETWGMRMEDRKGSDWIHLDDREPGPGGRYFKVL